QRLQQFAALEIPHPDSTVIAATGQSMAIGTDPERLDRPLVRFSHPHTLPTVYVPPAQHPIAASTDQQLSTLAPVHSKYAAGRVGKSVQELSTVGSAVGIPQEHLPTASLPLASATTGEPGAIGTPHHARNHAMMSLKRLE